MQSRLFKLADFIGPGEYFHFACKRLDARKPRFLHRHDYHEIFLVTQGTVTHYLGDGVSTLAKGDLVFVRPKDGHALRAGKEGPAEIINVAFRSAIAEHLGERYAADLDGRFFWHDSLDPEVHALSGPRYERAVNLSKELQLSRNSLVAIEEYLLAVCTRVVDYSAAPGSTMPDWLLNASAAVKEPRVFRQGAAGFVNAAGRGHEHVCRMARKHLGVSPSAFVNQVRMEYAAQLLASSDTPINQISRQCGIENISHFYRVFQRQYGTTPRQYRVNHHKNPVRAS